MVGLFEDTDLEGFGSEHIFVLSIKNIGNPLGNQDGDLFETKLSQDSGMPERLYLTNSKISNTLVLFLPCDPLNINQQIPKLAIINLNPIIKIQRNFLVSIMA